MRMYFNDDKTVILPIYTYNIFIVYKNFVEYEYLYKYEIFAKLLLKFKWKSTCYNHLKFLNVR